MIRWWRGDAAEAQQPRQERDAIDCEATLENPLKARVRTSWPLAEQNISASFQRLRPATQATLFIKDSRCGCITMAEQILDQVRDVFEGQIVSTP